MPTTATAAAASEPTAEATAEATTTAAAPLQRYLVLVAKGDDWSVASSRGRIVTTTERAQVPLGRLEGRRAPLIVATFMPNVETVDLTDLIAERIDGEL